MKKRRDFVDLKKLLNKEQYEAAVTTEGQLLILAGAGSGKTRVLTYRIAHMIEDLGVYPSQILAITFTNKAAGEMRERVRALVGDEVDNMWISTFHSSCVRILRREIDKLGYKKDFTIYDSYDQKTLLRQCMKELSINDKEITENEILNKIGEQKDRLVSPEQYKRENQYNFKENKIADVYVLYQKKLKSNNALDFDDLICKTVELFKKNQEVLEFYQRKFKYIMIDEYQDTNKSQYEFVNMLAAMHKNICVVGDDDQCIPEGSMIRTAEGNKTVETLKEQDEVLCAAGNGEVTTGTIEKLWKKEYEGPMITVKTEGGKEFKATPNHVTFARVNVETGVFYVYLMYKKDMGFRIGQTQAVRSRRVGTYASGLAVRLNQEQADKMWVLKVCESKGDASYYEQYFSVKYGIPTAVFSGKGRQLSMTQELIHKLFKDINTFEAADKLMEENFLYREYPHHFSSAVTRGNSSRKLVNLSFLSCKKSQEAGYYAHRISYITSGEETKEKIIEEGFSVRSGKGDGWRVETERRSYDDAEAYAKKLAATEALDIMRKAKLTEDKSFYFMPVGSLREGMSIAVQDNGKVIEDKVSEISVEEYKGYVYDLSIPSLRQYLCEDVVLHNCIYAWRGADIRNILDFEKDYPKAKVVKLEQNYRSKGNILDAANSVIKNNTERKDKVLRTDSESGDKIKIYRAYSDLEEGNYVVSTIQNLIDEDGRSYKDFAILYRTNAQSRVFEEIFIRRNIPYKIVGGTRFYDRKEIKDIMAYLKLVNNIDDEISLQRIVNVPKRNIGDTTVEKLLAFAAEADYNLYNVMLDVENVPGLTSRTVSSIAKFTDLIEDLINCKHLMTVSQFIKAVLDKTGYMKELEKSDLVEDESRIENLKELVSAAAEFENSSEDKSLSAFLEKVTLVSDIDNLEEDASTVVLMTVHSAKGLEFPVVFMVGMENGIFPGTSSFNNPKEMEESRRLCYVGITRAKEQLYMTSAEQRRVFGRTMSYASSDFLNEIEVQLKEAVGGGVKSTSNYGGNSYSQSKTSHGHNSDGSNLIRSLNGSEGSNNTRAINPHSLRNMDTNMSSASVSFEEGTNKISDILGGKKLTEVEATMGRKVKHNKFGIGTIISVTKEGSDTKLTVAFDNMGIKNLILSMAPLELL
jgi:DNA helicase-2/ATP-dependent DNA helicase PcrA